MPRIPLTMLLLASLAAAAAAGAAAVSPAPPAEAEAEAEAVVKAQLDAYNAHDLAAFVATYADDVQLFEHPATLLASGSAQLRERYAPRFRDPILHAEIAKRIVMGNVVVDHEKVTRTFPEGPGHLEAIAIYEVQGGKIAKAWLILGARVPAPAK